MASEFESTVEELKKGFLEQENSEHATYVYRLGLEVQFGTKLDSSVHNHTKCSTCQFIAARLKNALTKDSESYFKAIFVQLPPRKTID